MYFIEFLSWNVRKWILVSGHLVGVSYMTCSDFWYIFRNWFLALLCLCTMGSDASLFVRLSPSVGLWKLHCAPFQQYIATLCTINLCGAPLTCVGHHPLMAKLETCDEEMVSINLPLGRRRALEFRFKTLPGGLISASSWICLSGFWFWFLSECKPLLLQYSWLE